MNTTIEINGRIYDAKTGKIIRQSVESKKISRPQLKSTTKTMQRGVVMDGVARRPIANPPRPVNNTIPAANHTQKSSTLNRKAVKKPINDKLVPYVHSTSANVHSKIEKSATGRGLLLKRVPNARLSRAIASRKSTLVTKFSKHQNQDVKPVITHNLEVKKAPATSTPDYANQPSANSGKTEVLETPKKFVFEDRINNANSHLLKPVKKQSKRHRAISFLKISPKVISISAAVFAVIILGGFFAYQKVPSVSMRVAASKAGFEGKLPKNIPSGYAFEGPVKVEDGAITLSYASNSDSRKFVIVQRPTEWSSEGLLTNYLSDSQFRYQSYKDKGLTVYIFNGSNATWVNKGIWFSINGQDGELSSEQLLEVASSI